MLPVGSCHRHAVSFWAEVCQRPSVLYLDRPTRLATLQIIALPNFTATPCASHPAMLQQPTMYPIQCQQQLRDISFAGTWLSCRWPKLHDCLHTESLLLTCVVQSRPAGLTIKQLISVHLLLVIPADLAWSVYTNQHTSGVMESQCHRIFGFSSAAMSSSAAATSV